MGHDITARAINKHGVAGKNVVAGLRLGLGCKDKFFFYKSLKAEDYYGGVSGTGESKTYSWLDLYNSANFFITLGGSGEALEFLRKCMDYNNGVEIRFG